MKLFAAMLILVAAATVSPDIRYFHYVRPVKNTPQQAGPTCITLDAALYTRAAPHLADLRLYRDLQETPYLVQMEAPPRAKVSEQVIQPLNLGVRDGQTVFDAAIPVSIYSNVLLNVTGQDFIAIVTVSGSQQQSSAATKIGNYTIFDLTRQRLGRSTILHLPLSNFRYLHFRIAGPLRPENVTGLALELPEGKPAYTVIAESSQVRLKDHASIIEFTVPAHVPVERVAVVAGATPANFSRDTTIEIHLLVAEPASDSAEPPAPVTINGNLMRVHTIENSHHIDQEHLEIESPQPGFDAPSKWTVTIDNGDDAPLVPSSVRLEMFKHDLCFEASGGNYILYYGDAKLSPPRYDLGQFFIVHLSGAAEASWGPEEENPEFQPRPDDRPFTEKHPLLLWIALALVIVVLGGIAVRSAKPGLSS